MPNVINVFNANIIRDSPFFSRTDNPEILFLYGFQTAGDSPKSKTMIMSWVNLPGPNC